VTQVSTWQVQCGIAGYTELLCRGLAEHGVDWDVAPIDRGELGYLSRRELRGYFDELAQRFADADVVHIQHDFGFFAGSYHFRASVANFRHVLRAAQRGGRPAFVTFHAVPFALDWTAVDWSRLPIEELLMLGARRWWRAAVSSAVSDTRGPRAIVHGRTARRLLIDSGLAGRDIVVIPHGTPAPRPAPDPAARSEVRARLGLADDAVVLGIFGYLSGNKGHLSALKALAHLPDRFQLVLAGGPHPNDERSALGAVLESLHEQPGLRERVAVTGYLSEDAALRCIDAVDIMLAPYRDRSQVGSGALGWAMASGKPVVASRVPLFRELAEQSAAVELVAVDAPGELALAVERIADDSALRERLVAGARAWCRTHSWSNTARRHADLYEQALGGGGAAARSRRPPRRDDDVPYGANGSAPPGPSAVERISPLRAAGLPADVAAALPQLGLTDQPRVAALLRRTALPDNRPITFALDPRSHDDPLARILLERGYPGDLPCELAVHMLHSGGTFVDVGAHLGTFTLAAAAHGCRVLAVEASTTNVRLLRTAVAYNGFDDSVTVIHGAAAADDGVVHFHEEGPFGMVDIPGAATKGSGPGEDVTAYRLDRLIATHELGAVDLIKIDIEGYELEALAGLGTLLSGDDAPAILFECNAYALGGRGRTTFALKATLERLGYRLHLIDRSNPRHLVRCSAGDIQTEAAADYLGVKDEPAGLAPWVLTDPLSHAEVVERLRIEASGPEPPIRRYAAAVIRLAPDELREDPLLRATIIDLQHDADPHVRAVIDGEVSLAGYGVARDATRPEGSGAASPLGSG